MPETFTPLYEVWPENKQREAFAAMETKIATWVQTVQNRRTSLDKGALLSRLYAPLVYYPWLRRVQGLDRHFHADASCAAHGICARVCPVGNIAVVDGRPVWHHRCQQCFACFHFCPNHAIQFGSRTASRGRYHHPAAGVQDVAVRVGDAGSCGGRTACGLP